MSRTQPVLHSAQKADKNCQRSLVQRIGSHPLDTAICDTLYVIKKFVLIARVLPPVN